MGTGGWQCWEKGGGLEARAANPTTFIRNIVLAGESKRMSENPPMETDVPMIMTVGNRLGNGCGKGKLVPGAGVGCVGKRWEWPEADGERSKRAVELASSELGHLWLEMGGRGFGMDRS